MLPVERNLSKDLLPVCRIFQDIGNDLANGCLVKTFDTCVRLGYSYSMINP